MPQPDDPPPAPAIDSGEPLPNTRRILLIVIAVVLALAIGVVLHLTGTVGPA